MELTPFLFGLYKFLKYAVYPLTWVWLLLGGATLMVMLPPSSRLLRWTRVMLGLALGLLYLASNPFVAVTLTAWLESRHPAFDSSQPTRHDAIVVLGAGVRPPGSLRPSVEPTDVALERVFCAAGLFHAGIAPTLLVSGGDPSIFGAGPREAVTLKRVAMDLGVPEPAIRLEDRSRTTYENLVETRRLLGPARIALVTSAAHLPRAVALAEAQGFDVTPAPCGYHAKERPTRTWRDLDLFDFLPTASALDLATNALSEIAGMLVYRLAGKM